MITPYEMANGRPAGLRHLKRFEFIGVRLVPYAKAQTGKFETSGNMIVYLGIYRDGYMLLDTDYREIVKSANASFTDTRVFKDEYDPETAFVDGFPKFKAERPLIGSLKKDQVRLGPSHIRLGLLKMYLIA